MLICFDESEIHDNECRVSLVRDPQSSHHAHAFLLLEGKVDTELFFSIAEQTNQVAEDLADNRAYRIAFIDFTSKGLIRVVVGNNLQEVSHRLRNRFFISSSENFEKFSSTITANQAAGIYNMATAQQAIQSSNDRNREGYIDYFSTGGGTVLANSSASSNGKKYHNCFTWALELLTLNEINVSQRFSLIQRSLLPFVAYPPSLLCERFIREHKTTAALGAVAGAALIAWKFGYLPNFFFSRPALPLSPLEPLPNVHISYLKY